MPKVGLWARLYSIMTNLETRQEFSEEMELPAAMALDTLMQNIVATQPHGHIEHDPMGYYAVGTVSERIGHTPISDGWRTSIEQTGAGVKTQIKNVSEHISVVITGTTKKDYQIPTTAPHVFFWWGTPQPWPAPSVNYEGEEMGPGYYKFPAIIHPGQEENPFVADAVGESTPTMKAFIGHGVANWIRGQMFRHGLREK